MRRNGETYDEYIRRVGQYPIARRVKLVDLDDNIANSRGVDSTQEERERIERYERARVSRVN